jgi:predicted DNA-binding protein (UPF0251 family)/predicted Fe-Mo cluster-binding NifX family protein
MSRPCKCRRIYFMPGVTYFKPAGIPMRFLEENCLSLEEMEAVRLRDLEHLEQVEGARQMNISRLTYQRVLASARRKIADSLLSGKALRIEGGNYELSNQQVESVSENLAVGTDNVTTRDNTMKENKFRGEQGNMKIAVISEDEKTISQHFGMARLYVVFTIEDGKMVSKETRNKAGHHNMGAHYEEHAAGQRHGFDAGAQQTHATMAGNITDCQVLIAGGMGWGAHESLKSFNIEPIITDVKDIDQAVKLYLEGNLPNLMERLH